MTETQPASNRNPPAVPVQKTVFCTLNPADRTRYIELLTLNGVSLNIDSPGGLSATTTNLRIDGISYLPYGCGIDIVRDGDTVTIVTSVLVTARRD